MNIPRREFLQLAAGAASLPVLPDMAFADTYPSRPIHMIAGFAAGSASDINARLLGQTLGDKLGQTIVIENRAGAGGNIATDYVVRSAPDGYTLLYASTAIAINQTLYAGKINFNVQTDLAPVASVVRTPVVMEVSPTIPVKTVAEFIAYAKANPGKINAATVGAGSLQHLCVEYFKMAAGVDIVPIHYRGATQAITDLIAGRVQVMFDIMVSSLAYIRSGKLRALAVASDKPNPLLPNIPTISQTVPGFEANGWQGVCAPSKTPADIITQLNKEINAALDDPNLKKQITGLGGELAPGTPADFGKFIAVETKKWGKAVEQAGLKPT